jgi:hypothetical protein
LGEDFAEGYLFASSVFYTEVGLRAAGSQFAPDPKLAFVSGQVEHNAAFLLFIHAVTHLDVSAAEQAPLYRFNDARFSQTVLTENENVAALE